MEAQTVLNKAGFSMADISQRSIQHSAYLTLGRMTYYLLGHSSIGYTHGCNNMLAEFRTANGLTRNVLGCY
jgi:hypothetical protein